MEPLHPAAAAQEERGAGPLLQRPDHRAGEEVRDAEIPLPAGEEAPRQDAAAQREAGEAVPAPWGTAPQPRAAPGAGGTGPCRAAAVGARLPGTLPGGGGGSRGAGSCFLFVARVRLLALTGSETTPCLLSLSLLRSKRGFRIAEPNGGV